MKTQPPGSSYAFGAFVADVARRRLLRDGELVPLTRKALETLFVLLENAGRVVDKEDLIERVWPDTHVDENNLNQTISAVRRALSDDRTSPRWIETVSKRGYRFIGQLSANATRAETRATLAVLPFRLLGSADEAYLGVGLADTLITRLSGIERLTVRPTSAVLPYAKREDVDPLRAGRELAVDSVVDGTIRKAGDRVRVTVQLLSVTAETPAWAGKYDENLTDIFALEDAISERIAAALIRKLTEEETAAITHHPTEDAAAYQAYLQGRYFADRLSRESFEKSVACFEHAIARDDRYALAYAGLAHSYVQAVDLFLAPGEAMPRAQAAAEKALALDPSLAEARIAIASVAFWYHRDWAAAKREALAAIAANPRSVFVRWFYAFFLGLRGEFEEAFAQFARASEIDPFSFEKDLYFVAIFYFARRFDELEDRARAMVRGDPGFWLAHVNLGRALEQLGRLDESIAQYRIARGLDEGVSEILGDLGRALARSGATAEARAVLADLESLAQTRYVSPYLTATIRVALGDHDHALRDLQRAVAARSFYVSWLAVDPAMDALRGRAGFGDLLAG